MSEDQKPTIEPGVGKLLTAVEMAESFSVPSLSTNRWFIQPIGSNIRIAFAESPPGTDKVFFRVAVTLSNQEAVNFYKLLEQMLKPFEDATAALRAAAEAQKDG